MSISDIKKSSRKEIEKLVFNYLIVTIVCAGFGAVYEWFSHGVYSYYMIYAFMVPLLGGTLPFYCVLHFGNKIPGRMSRRFQHFGISTLTAGCLFLGALKIYGITNHLVNLYFIVGGLFLFVGNLMYLLQKKTVV
ncbi:MAG: hypothetical protein Q4C84_15870 [Bacillota bacterium]|nr:hypothetical protein [Bacillota bacterium]